jgi:hypothetical protein
MLKSEQSLFNLDPSQIKSVVHYLTLARRGGFMAHRNFTQCNIPLSVVGNFAPTSFRRLYYPLAAFVFAAWAFPALAEDGTTSASDATFAYVLVGGVALATIIGLAIVRSALSGSTWSLSDALSEEADISPLDKDGKPFPGPDGKPQIISELRASSSRFIALIGLIAILMMYIGFGLVAIKQFASGNTLPGDAQFKEITTFLFAGVTMFAPYIVNKFSSVFDWLKPTK